MNGVSKGVIAVIAAVAILAAGAGWWYFYSYRSGDENEPPEARFSIRTRAINANQTVSFSAASSTDRDGDIVYYKWDFGDGSTARGREVTHVYSAGGTYTVTLTVIDDAGAVASYSTEIVVNDPPRPVIKISAKEGHVGEIIDFDATASSDRDGTITAYKWYFGDGGSASGAKVAHKYTSLGTYTVKLVVTDDRNASSNTTVEFSVVERQYLITWTTEEETLAQRGNTTNEGETSVELVSITRKNMVSISFILTWTDNLPLPAPLKIRKNTPDEFRLNVTGNGMNGTVSGTDEKLVLTFDLAPLPLNDTITAVDKATAEEYAASIAETLAGIGDWIVQITAVNCGDGLLVNGGLFPDTSNSWNLEVRCMYFVPHAEEIKE